MRQFFTVFFTSEAPLEMLGLQTEQMQPADRQEPIRYLLCTSVSGTDLGLARLEMEQTEGRTTAWHVPPRWIACVGEGDARPAAGFAAG